MMLVGSVMCHKLLVNTQKSMLLQNMFIVMKYLIKLAIIGTSSIYWIRNEWRETLDVPKHIDVRDIYLYYFERLMEELSLIALNFMSR